MNTIAVIEGFAGGPKLSKTFRSGLGDAGFRIIKDKTKADIIVAHSAGIYAIPITAPAKLLLLIGPIYWPGKPLAARWLNHFRTSSHNRIDIFNWRNAITMRTLETYYFFRRHSFMWLGIKNNNRLERIHWLANTPGRKVIIVRNDDDPFSTSDLSNYLKGEPIKFVSLPGMHGDYYTNPKPYIDLLLKEL